METRKWRETRKDIGRLNPESEEEEVKVIFSLSSKLLGFPSVGLLSLTFTYILGPKGQNIR